VEGGGIGGSIQEAEVPYLTVWVLVHAVRYRTDELWIVKFEKFGQCRWPKRKKVKKKIKIKIQIKVKIRAGSSAL
jgi:hypothetical protein